MTRTERTYLLLLGLWSAAGWCIAPIYPLFLRHIGLDVFEVNAVAAVHLLAVFVADVPTGALADVVGRRASFLGSCVLRGLAYFLYAFASSFTDCVVLELIDAVGVTLASGALDAWAVDGVRARDTALPLDRLFARGQIVMRGSMMIGLVSGYLGDVDLAFVWWLAAVGFAASGVAAVVAMHEGPRPIATERASVRHVASTIREGFAAARTSPTVRGICLLSATAAFAGAPILMLWPGRVQALAGPGFALLGWVWAGMSLAGVAGGIVVARRIGRLGRGRVLVAFTATRGAAIAAAGAAASTSSAVAGLLVHEVALGAVTPTAQAWLNDHVGSSLRATILSVASMAFTLGGAAGLLVLGLVARTWGIPVAWYGSAVVFAASAAGWAALARRDDLTNPG